MHLFPGAVVTFTTDGWLKPHPLTAFMALEDSSQKRASLGLTGGVPGLAPLETIGRPFPASPAPRGLLQTGCLHFLARGPFLHHQSWEHVSSMPLSDSDLGFCLPRPRERSLIIALGSLH